MAGDFCKSCTTRVACDLNNVCKIADSAKVEAPTLAADVQDSSYRAEIERLTSKLAIQSKILRDAGIERERLSKELTAANDSLIAARSQIADLTHRVTVSANHCAALIAEQKEAAVDHQRELREYATTRQFHQPTMARYKAMVASGELKTTAGDANHPDNAGLTRGVSIPTTEWDVTAEEDEAFAAREIEYIDRNGDRKRISAIARTSAEIRLDDLDQRMERVENAYLVQQGRINTAHDRLDGIKDI